VLYGERRALETQAVADFAPDEVPFARRASIRRYLAARACEMRCHVALENHKRGKVTLTVEQLEKVEILLARSLERQAKELREQGLNAKPSEQATGEPDWLALREESARRADLEEKDSRVGELGMDAAGASVDANEREASRSVPPRTKANGGNCTITPDDDLDHHGQEIGDEQAGGVEGVEGIRRTGTPNQTASVRTMEASGGCGQRTVEGVGEIGVGEASSGVD
jgi:hypothetical protein